MTSTGSSANAEKVRAGMASVHFRHVIDRTLHALQEDARTDARGLWVTGGLTTQVPGHLWRM